MLDDLIRRGFLPNKDPVTRFERHPELSVLDELGERLPNLLENTNSTREYLRAFTIPTWPVGIPAQEDIEELRLYYVRLGFIASGYINQIGAPECHLLPGNIALPFVQACKLLNRPPILSYDGYALYNWYRIDPDKPITLGNIDTLQNFVNLYDEHWFILVHIEIEALAAEAIAAIIEVANCFDGSRTKTHDVEKTVNSALEAIHRSLEKQILVLRRIPEKMSPLRYFSHFRPYIRFFENVEYEGIDQKSMSYRGETGAQSSIMPALVEFMKIPHAPNDLINHLRDMRNYMPLSHRQWLSQLENLPNLKPWSEPSNFNAVLDSMARFRDIHFQWAEEYIHSKVTDPRGTGGTPYMKWLKQLVNETLDYKIESV